MVAGAEELAARHGNLWFITITCRGAGLSVVESEAGYTKWCNTFLTALRTDATRRGKEWHYAIVTERQKRGHPHSHILTTYEPRGIYLGWKADYKRHFGILRNEWKACLRSDWLQTRCVSAGLGEQYDISQTRNIKAASRYVAKYMFKDTALGVAWPKGWKRVRYSQSWPKLPDFGAENEAMALLGQEDWTVLGSRAAALQCTDEESYQEAKYQVGLYMLLKPPKVV
jgi:hypothetical protein